MSFVPAAHSGRTPVAGLLVEDFDLAFELDQQGLAFAVDLLACGNLDPAFADAVLLDIHAFFVIEADADVAFKHGGVEEGAAGIDGQAIGQGGGLLLCVAHDDQGR